jgi:hypothetical protein
VKTVEDCVTETQTGHQRRRKERQVDHRVPRESLSRLAHAVSEFQLAELTVRAPDIALDMGERALWAHALTREDGWVLCGPDRVSMRMGVRLGLRERMISLERLLVDVGYQGGGASNRRAARSLDPTTPKAEKRRGIDADFLYAYT